MPGTALPGFQIVPATFLGVVAERMSIHLVKLDVDGAGNLCTRGLGQDAEASMEGLVVPGRRPEIVGSMDRHAHLTGRGQVRRHGRANHVHLLREDGVYVRLDWVQPWRNEDSRCVGTLLVNIVDDFRMPHVLDLPDGCTSLRLREDVPVAIVVVTGVMVIQLRRLRPFERGVESLSVPTGDDVDSIWILRGNKDQNRVLTNLFESRGVIREHLVGELNGAMGGSDLGGVNRTRHENDILSLRKKRLGLIRRSNAGIGQAPLNIEILVQLLHCLRRTDDGLDEGPAFGSLADFFNANARAGLFELVEIRDDLVPIEKNTVHSYRVAKMALRSGNRGGCKHPGCSGKT